MTSLFDPLTAGALHLPHRILMAPLTRQRAAVPGDVPHDLMREYYVQRAEAALIFSEGTQISAEGKGYGDTPGLYTAAQIAGWRRITDAVHAAGGRIAAQLWHTGRVNHASLHGGALPVSASALPFTGRTTLIDDHGAAYRAECPTPRALETRELPRVVADFAHATRAARDAGFDAVEVHAAHGYLLHQFLSSDSNHRTDAYGGSIEARMRLTLEVVDAVIGAWSADRVGIRISPLGPSHGIEETPDDAETGLRLAAALSGRDLAFLHLSETGRPGSDDAFRDRLRTVYPGVIVAAGGYDRATAERTLADGTIDAVAFGRAFLANPDLPSRFRTGAELNSADSATFYGGDARGYTDYPVVAGR